MRKGIIRMIVGTVLIVLQVISIIGGAIKGRAFPEFYAQNGALFFYSLFTLFGFLLPAIIGIILFISGYKAPEKEYQKMAKELREKAEREKMQKDKKTISPQQNIATPSPLTKNKPVLEKKEESVHISKEVPEIISENKEIIIEKDDNDSNIPEPSVNNITSLPEEKPVLEKREESIHISKEVPEIISENKEVIIEKDDNDSNIPEPSVNNITSLPEEKPVLEKREESIHISEKIPEIISENKEIIIEKAENNSSISEPVVENVTASPEKKVTVKKQKEPKIRYCKHCGNLIDNDSKKCTGCSKQYFRISKTAVLMSVLSLIIIASGTINIVQYQTIKDKSEEIPNDNTSSNIEEKIITVNDKKTEPEPTSTEANTSNNTNSKEEANSQASVSKHTHNFSAATCTSPKTCSCGATEGNALGHSYKLEVTYPTCTTQGYTTYTCSCGDSYTDNYTNTAHNYHNYKCSSCGSIDKSHAYEYLAEWIKENGIADASHINVSSKSGDSTYSLSYVVDNYGDYISVNKFTNSQGTNSYISLQLNSYFYGMNLGDYKMTGYISANTFTENSPVSYKKYNGPADLSYEMNELARLSLCDILDWLKWLLNTNNVGITIKDLGFNSF